MVMTSRALLQEPGQILQGLQDEVYCRLWPTKWEMWAMFVVSTYNLVLITVGRYISVNHAIWHKTSFTKTKAIVSIIMVWIFGMFYMGAYIIIPTAVVDGSCALFSSDRAQSGTGIMNFVSQNLIPCSSWCSATLGWLWHSAIASNQLVGNPQT